MSDFRTEEGPRQGGDPGTWLICVRALGEIRGAVTKASNAVPAERSFEVQ
jgi:hypothetical protein